MSKALSAWSEVISTYFPLTPEKKLRAERFRELEGQLIEYHRGRPHWYTATSGFYECGSEFGVAYIHFDEWASENGGEWVVDWIAIEECPIDLAELPKGDE